MSVKDEVLKELELHKGDYISGGELANRLSVSRNSVWKAIKQLEKQGYPINAITNKGYCLSTDSILLSSQSISKYLNSSVPHIETFTSVTSTNDLVRHYAEEGAPDWTVIIAEEQVKGRGRLGRSFYSPAETGIYMSLLLRPTIPIQQTILLTTCAAVAVTRALISQTGIKPQIKWVNDIYYHDKKVCGILSEAAVDMENGAVKYAILGIGINIFPPVQDFPKDIRKTATSVFSSIEQNEDYRSKIIAEIINQMMELYPHLTEKTFYEEYKAQSMLLGKPIQILTGPSTAPISEPAIALDIDEDLRLVVEKEDGTISHLNSGEVSIRVTT
ncbi:MAG: biotin--[acetyl-CoA-carboxylase] ligase [Lachnospiraceae bacterium]|nr:biotin--[acetyl-CoA-carboxylase] ligase [Lachnospiraceae bacterium]